MDAIAALYGSDSSDAEDASDAELRSEECCADLGADSADCAAGGSDAEGDTEDGVAEAPVDYQSHKRQRRAGDSPPKWKRAFAHVDGNWPSHVNVEIAATDEVARLVDGIVERAQTVMGKAVTLVPLSEQGNDERDLHLSLSRPFVLTYEQIETFVNALRAALKWRTRFTLALDQPIVLVNDDASRSFLALQVGAGADHVVNLLKCVDKCMREFGLQTYYENPIPHVSIASALGDSLRGALSPNQLLQLRPDPLDELSSVVVRVASVQVIIGNKHFHIPLR